MTDLNRQNQKPKLLSPISSFDEVVRVIRAGADEVYCGVMNPSIRNFWLYRGPPCEVKTYEELNRIVDYAHNHDVDVIVTVNEPFLADVIEKEVERHIRSCVDKGVDALMVGSFGVLSLIKAMGVDIPLYASTYMVTTNFEAVNLLSKLGFSRVILERHLTISEISDIVRKSKIEVEAFVHGAGCSNINGRCFLFHFKYPPLLRAQAKILGFHNPCNLPFKIYDLNDRESMIDNLAIMDAFTCCSLCTLPELIHSGVSGLKVVGRCSNVAIKESVTKIYRELIDLIASNQLTSFQKKVESLKKDFYTQPPYLLGLQEVGCEQRRCFYNPLFHTPYRYPMSWRAWTKFQFTELVVQD